jgi:signal transduction histidine kinase
LLTTLRPYPNVLSSGVDTFKRQETIFLCLNLLLLTTLLWSHTIFTKQWGSPSAVLILTVVVGFVANLLELVWLRRLSRPVGQSVLTFVTWTSIGFNLCLGLLLSVLSNTRDSPYFVLMLIPILQAAFRFPILTLTGVVGVASAFNFVWIWAYFQTHQPYEPTELLEAAITSLTFAIVGFVVWLLVTDLRRKEERLAENILDLQRTREKLLLEEKLAAVGRLSSAIAHEIKNPVSLISTSIANARQLPVPQREEMYAIASEEADRLVALTSDFLSYAHPRSPKSVPMSVNDTIGYVSDACRAHAANRHITLEVEAPEPVTTQADPGQLQQALINLVLNAVESSPQGGQVKVRSYVEDHKLFIDTENTGKPIPEGDQALIFEPFYTTRPKGTGLGLSIARNIARAHGGDIVLTSNDAHRICFSLNLPFSNGNGNGNGRKATR